jgi:hypothetical protein
MKIEIRARGLRLTQPMRAQARLTLGLALDRFASRVRRVLVKIHSGGLPTAPEHILCRVDVDARPMKVRIDELDSDLSAAVTRAAHRAARTIARALELQRALLDR